MPPGRSQARSRVRFQSRDEESRGRVWPPPVWTHTATARRASPGHRSRGFAEQRGMHGQSPRHECPSSGRSEEHTSELQSLMRISYAVFCLKKKKKKKKTKVTS